jgi:hypothetical protein
MKQGMKNRQCRRELHAWKQKEGRGNKSGQTNADLSDQDLLAAYNDGILPPE